MNTDPLSLVSKPAISARDVRNGCLMESNEMDQAVVTARKGFADALNRLTEARKRYAETVVTKESPPAEDGRSTIGKRD